MSTLELPFEGRRIVFVTRRDGEQAAVEFVARTYRTYRLSLKCGMAREERFRRTYVESCADFRRFLRVHNAYLPVLRELK